VGHYHAGVYVVVGVEDEEADPMVASARTDFGIDAEDLPNCGITIISVVSSTSRILATLPISGVTRMLTTPLSLRHCREYMSTSVHLPIQDLTSDGILAKTPSVAFSDLSPDVSTGVGFASLLHQQRFSTERRKPDLATQSGLI